MQFQYISKSVSVKTYIIQCKVIELWENYTWTGYSVNVAKFEIYIN